MEQEYNLENELAEVVFTLKSTLALVNIKILTEDINEKTLNTEVFNKISKIDNIKSIISNNSFREVNKEGKYLLNFMI